jgi:predicted nucleic acid-binding Zn ribbon protein
MADRNRRQRFPTPVAKLLAETFRGKPLEKRLGEAEIWRVWDGAVGGQIASKARPSKFNDGVLTVIVTSAPWMQQLNFMKRDIVQRLNEKIGKSLVREIYLKSGRPPAVERQATAWKPERRALTPEETARIEATVGVITDPELRRAFADLLAEQASHIPAKD